MKLPAAAVYDECYPGDEWTPLPFEEAERHGTIHYRQAVGAAQRCRAIVQSKGSQLSLPAIL